MHHISFGDVLKEARLARGLDLATVSRDLRIRQDIIVAIENSDFSRMPSRGYARNMIIAYARLLGLNAQDISRMYLDQEYAYQVERAQKNVAGAIQMHDEPYRRSRNSGQTGEMEKVRGSRTSRSMQNTSSSRMREKNLYDGSSNGLGRRVYSQNIDAPRTPPMPTRSNAPVAHRARRSAMTEGRYTNLYAAPKNIPNPNRQRNVIIAAVAIVAIVIILIVAMALSHQNQPQTNIPVTGVNSTSQQDQQTETDTTPVETETAPTEFTLRYEVADGNESYIEVYVDDKTQESATVSGPAQQTYTSSGTIRFVSTETAGVTVYVNDEAVELKTNSSGIINQTFTFEDILNAWYDAHPNATRPTSTSANTSNDTDGTSSNSSDTSTRSNSSSSSGSSSE